MDCVQRENQTGTRLYTRALERRSAAGRSQWPDQPALEQPNGASALRRLWYGPQLYRGKTGAESSNSFTITTGVLRSKGANTPRQGRAVVVGAHRGFMPFDGVMAFEFVAREVGRYMRFLIHPCLIKTPFPFDFNKLGCLNVSRENADYVLQHDELLAFSLKGFRGLSATTVGSIN